MATEIGLNESVLLLQYEFWLATEGEERDGYTWIRRTVREIRQDFCFWSTGTVNNIIQSLVKNGYLIEGKYDEGPGKNGRWLRFDFERLATLKSIQVICSDPEQPLSKKSAYLSNSRTTVLIKKESNKKYIPQGVTEPADPAFLISEVKDPVTIDPQGSLRAYLQQMFPALDFDKYFRKWWGSKFQKGGIARRVRSRATQSEYWVSIETYFQACADNPSNGNGYHDAKPVQRVQTIRERMGLDG